MTDPNHQDPPGTDLPREEPPTLSAADPPSAASLPSTAGLSTDETADGALLEIPGRPHPVHEPEAPELDLKGLLADLLDSAQRESSAATKSRALLVASDLSLFLGRRDVAVETARSAADIAPKSALAATQARALGVDDQEGLIRRLETTMRLAESAPSRTHIALQLAAELSRQGSTLKASGVLDHIARLGSLDMRVQLQRLLTRLTSGEPLGGLALSSPLKEKGEAIEELLGGSEAQLGASEAQLGASEAQDPRAYLEYFRVAKELRHARVSDAMRVLDAGHLEPERKGELLSAHAARLPGGLPASRSRRCLRSRIGLPRSRAR